MESGNELGDLPLAGVRVVDMSTSYAGPTATMYLADLGAEVIKVERPGGDDARGWGPPFIGADSVWFASANRGKKSVVLDVRAEAGREVLERLVGSADVFVENLNPAKLAALDLDPVAVLARHPRLVYCALSGFGLTGPDAARPGYDLIAQARSGLMSVTGARGGPPQRVSTALSDVAAGMVTALVAVAVLRRVERGGAGEIVDVSLLDVDLALMAPRLASYLAGEPEPRPSGGTDSVLAVYHAFETADRPIAIAVGSDAIWRRLCAVLGRADLAADPELATNAGRRGQRDRIVDALGSVLRGQPSGHWLPRLAAANVPSAAIATLSQVVADPQVVARGGVVDLPVGDDGAVARGVTSPWRFGRTRPPLLAVPGLGAHTGQVLTDLGLSSATVRALAEAGVVMLAE